MKTPLYYISRFKDQFRSIHNESERAHARWRINMALARGAASAGLRTIDPSDPRSWEFSGFSQNGEDGIIDYLLFNLKTQNRYFVEIGASNGLENNISWLAIVRRYSGLMVEGDALLAQQCRQNFASLNWGLQIVAARVTLDNIREVVALSLHSNPDLLSLDIDGIDHYVMKEILALGCRPKIIVVEYNSTFGPKASITVKYKPDFDIAKEHSTRLYYGVSVVGWRRFFSKHGYRFVTVDQNGVNAFFVDEKEFAPSFLNGVQGLEFQENFAQQLQHRTSWEGQYELIKNSKFVEIE